MLKILFVVLIVVHGLLHLIGFISILSPSSNTSFSGKTIFPIPPQASKVAGLLWLVTCLLMLSSAVLFIMKIQSWWVVGITGIVLSQLLIILYWPEAKVGTFANVLILLPVLWAYGNWNFNKTIKNETKYVMQQVHDDNNIVTVEMIKGLPMPVQRWLVASGMVGKPVIHSVIIHQKGMMRLKPGSNTWVNTSAEQATSVDDPAFVWHLSSRLSPLMPISGRDKFIDGKGRMQIKLYSVVNLVNQADKKIDQGALQRFLAEICWYPSGALSPYIKWKAIDSTTAEATLTYKGTSGAVTFHFNNNGDLAYATALRYMGGGNKATLEKWLVTTKESAVINGIRVPVKSEVTWQLKGGDFTWYKLEVTGVEYNKRG